MAEARGRPRQGDEAKRVPLSFRTTPRLRDALDAAAEESGRSLAQEVEARLERSFRDDYSAGGPEQAEVLDTMRRIMEGVNRHMGVSWLAEPNAWSLTTDAIARLMLILEPDESESVAPPLFDWTPENREAINAFREKYLAWSNEKDAIGHVLIRNMMRANGGQDLTDEEKQAGVKARARRKELGPEPTPDLPPDELAAWRAEEEWSQKTARATNAAVQIVDAVLRERRKI